MRRQFGSVLLTFALTVACLLTTGLWREADAADSTPIAEGAWIGGPMWGSGGKFEACAIAATDGLPDVFIDLDEQARLYLLVIPEEWSTDEGSEHATALSVDGKWGANLQAIGLAGGLFFEFLYGSEDAFHALRSGKVLKIVANRGTIEVPLRESGADRALAALERCLADHAGVDVSGRPLARAPTPVAQPATAEEAVIAMLRALLMAGGHAEPKFTVKNEDFISWSQPGNPVAGIFANVSSGDNATQTLAVGMAGMEQECEAQTAYDTPAPSNFDFAGRVFSGSLECSKRGKAIHVVALELERSLWLFVLTAPADDGALARLAKQSLRTAFAR